MKKILTFIAIAIVSVGYSQSEVKKAKLYEGTIIKAALTKDLKGGSVETGQQIEFILAEPIIIGDKVICQKGARIVGTITEARSSGILGRKGKLAFDINFLYMPSGQVIVLKSDNNSKKLNSSTAVVVASAVIFAPVALFIPGKGAKYVAGTTFDAFVEKDTFID